MAGPPDYLAKHHTTLWRAEDDSPGESMNPEDVDMSEPGLEETDMRLKGNSVKAIPRSGRFKLPGGAV